jgi:hypothetical protein
VHRINERLFLGFCSLSKPTFGFPLSSDKKSYVIFVEFQIFISLCFAMDKLKKSMPFTASSNGTYGE